MTIKKKEIDQIGRGIKVRPVMFGDRVTPFNPAVNGANFSALCKNYQKSNQARI
jgi:hypothetical protein